MMTSVVILAHFLAGCNRVDSVASTVRTTQAIPQGTDIQEYARVGFSEADARKRGINIRGEFGDTQLTWAVFHGNASLVEKLLARGANPNVLALGPAFGRDCESETPLIGAIRRKNRQILRLLLQHKANPNLPDENGRA